MLYRYKIMPKSPLMTPLMSDTLFGHFCWALLYLRGEDFLTDFLDSYGKDKPSPLLFSSAFLSGHLPRPDLPPMSRDQANKFVSAHFGNNIKARYLGFSRLKGWSKIRLIKMEQWLSLKDGYANEVLYKTFASENVQSFVSNTETEVSSANTINRISGAVEQEGGGLFQREKIWYHEGTELDLYIEAGDGEIKDLAGWFLTEYLPEHGFGADKSVGMGSLSVSPDDTFDPGMLEVKDPNARLSLSAASFRGMEKYLAFYRLNTKFGKLGGSYSVTSPTGGHPKPFKKPVLMFEPGAVFFTPDKLNSVPLLDRVHSDGRIRHYGIPLTLPFKTRENSPYAAA